MTRVESVAEPGGCPNCTLHRWSGAISIAGTEGAVRGIAPQIPALTSVLARNRHAGAASTREDDLRRLFFEPIVLGTA